MYDRQDLHERIRQHSQAAAEQIKKHGQSNDLMDRLRADEAFAGVDFEGVADARQFVGRAPQQVLEFVESEVEPVRSRFASQIGADEVELRV